MKSSFPNSNLYPCDYYKTHDCLWLSLSSIKITNQVVKPISFLHSSYLGISEGKLKLMAPSYPPDIKPLHGCLTLALVMFLGLWQIAWPESTCGGKGLFHLIVQCPLRRELRAVTQSRNLGAGSEAESMEECCLLAPNGFPSLPSYSTQDHLPRDGTIHRCLRPPT